MKDSNSRTTPRPALVREGRFIRDSRRKMDLSQLALAKHLGISQSKLSKIEQGIMRIGIREWFLFCKRTGTPVVRYWEFLVSSNLVE